jgi:hypothetical protein
MKLKYNVKLQELPRLTMLIKGFVTDIKDKALGYILKNMMGKVPHDVATLFNLVKPKPEAKVEVLVGDEVDGASEGVIGAATGVLGKGEGLFEWPRGLCELPRGRRRRRCMRCSGRSFIRILSIFRDGGGSGNVRVSWNPSSGHVNSRQLSQHSKDHRICHLFCTCYARVKCQSESLCDAP